MKNRFKKLFLVYILLNLMHSAFPQNLDSAKSERHFSGAITVTNKGISLIPTFTLGKPAVIFDLSTGKRRLSFDPQLRFALEGKPWSFLFWWRYKLIRTSRFSLNVGGHPALNFRTVTSTINGVSKKIMVIHRYLAGELTPNYYISKKISIGMYYLYSHGFEEDAIGNTHFLTINSNFSNIKLPNRLYMRFNPRLYYLKTDSQDGFYFTSTISLARENFPLSVSSIINKAIQTDITASKNFIWNVSLVYSFNKQYVEK